MFRFIILVLQDIESFVFDLLLQPASRTDGILENLQVLDVVKKDTEYIIFFEEQNIHSKKYSGKNFILKGFYEPVTFQDFPLHGKVCFIKIKRKRGPQRRHRPGCDEVLEHNCQKTLNEKGLCDFSKELLDNHAINCQSLSKFFHVGRK